MVCYNFRMAITIAIFVRFKQTNKQTNRGWKNYMIIHFVAFQKNNPAWIGLGESKNEMIVLYKFRN